MPLHRVVLKRPPWTPACAGTVRPPQASRRSGRRSRPTPRTAVARHCAAPQNRDLSGGYLKRSATATSSLHARCGVHDAGVCIRFWHRRPCGAKRSGFGGMTGKTRQRRCNTVHCAANTKKAAISNISGVHTQQGAPPAGQRHVRNNSGDAIANCRQVIRCEVRQPQAVSRGFQPCRREIVAP